MLGFLWMSTLEEIEQAAEILPPEEKRSLILHLVTSLRNDGSPLPMPRDIPKETIVGWIAEDEADYRAFLAGS